MMKLSKKSELKVYMQMAATLKSRWKMDATLQTHVQASECQQMT